MIKSKGILTISIISLFAVESAYAAIASSGYVDQQVETRISEVVEAGTGNVVSSISTEGTKVTANKDINAEVTSNKTTSIAAAGSASDAKYPSEKAVATALDAKQDKLEGEVLTNTATGSGSLSTGGASVASTDAAVSIGPGSYVGAGSVAVGNKARAANNAVVIGSGSSLHNNVVVGVNAYGTGDNAVSIGNDAYSNTKSVAIGSGANAQNASNMIAIGNLAKTSADYAIQLGDGTNSEANTLSVGLDGTNNYKLLGSDGKIPAERLPNGILTNTATGDGSFSTANANPATSSFAVAIGNEANTYTASTAVGYQAYTEAYEGTAVGYQAKAPGYRAVALGSNANSTDEGASSIGAYSAASGYHSTGLGTSAKAQADYAIQLGTGTNSEANTLSVGLDGTNNYKLLGSDGKIPAERLPFTGDVLTNTATGNASFSTGNASPASAGSAVAIGEIATVQNGGTAIGYLTSSGVSGVALGARASSNKMGGVSMGAQSAVEGDRGIAVGTGAQSAGESSISIGTGAGALSDYAIQLGRGTNSEANTLSVGLGNSNNYKLLGSDGKIPAERLPVARIPVGSETSTSYASIWVE